MGRLDRRTAAAERRKHIRLPVVEPQPISAELWRAIGQGVQRHSAHQVYQVAQKFMEFMAYRDYPGLQTVIIPVVCWWWPFQRSACKAAWKLVSYYDNDTEAAVYLLASTGQLLYMESAQANRRARVTFREWNGECADQVVEALETIAEQYSR